MMAFNIDDTQILSRAFDQAWEILKESSGAVTEMSSARELLAKRIMMLARVGECDERRLVTEAVAYFRSHQGSWTQALAPHHSGA
jgi:hypothetical protein